VRSRFRWEGPLLVLVATVPIYEYRCTVCGQVAQRLEDVGTDSSGEKCPVCMAGEMKKIFSLFGTGLDGSADSCAPKANNRYK